MGNLSVLIGTISDKGERETAGLLPPPSPAAMAAPPVTVDVILTCGEELCAHLEAANNEVWGVLGRILDIKFLIVHSSDSYFVCLRSVLTSVYDL